MDVILTHTRADFDSIGSMIGAKHLNPRAIIALPAALNANVRRFVGLYREAFGMTDLASLDLADVERVILVDTQDPHRAGAIQPLIDRSDVRWEIVDHHPPGDRLPPRATAELRPTGAATTLLVSRLRARDAALTAPEATAMLLGVMEDTGRLSFPGTTPEDAEAVAYLLAQGARLDHLSEYLDAPLSAEQQELFTAALEAARLENVDGTAALLIALDHPALDDMSRVLDRLVDLEQPDLAVMVVRSGQHTQIIGRARHAGIDLPRLLSPWGAKGHPGAVSGHSEDGLDPAEVIAGVIERLPGALQGGLAARDLMSSPVRSLGFDTTAHEALEALRLWGHTAMPVVHNERVQGVISRRDLDRAIHHGFGDRPIKGLVNRRVESVGPDTPLAELRSRMADLDIGRLLVLDQGRLVGIVTRSDLIRVLDELDRTPGGAHARVAQLAGRLERLWPDDWRQVLVQVGRIAGDRPVYLVGGAVRDLLLERPSFDVDLMVEGDAIALARDLARELGARVKVHEAFGTAHVTLPTGKRVDLATARIEHYPHPGALPVVSPATVRQDLTRRDFTINALAMRINPARFGELLDFFGGLRDLEDRIVRVLHPVSFIEDPVRLFRAVRFETKLGFGMDPHTEAYGRYAMESGRFDGMGSERLKLELRLGLGLSRVARLVNRLDELDAWRMVHPDLRVSPAVRRSVRRLDLLRGTSALESASEDPWLVPLGLLLADLRAESREQAIEPLHLRREERSVLEAAWTGTSWLDAQSKEMESMPDPALARRLSGMPDAALWVMAARTPSARIRRRLCHYTSVLRPLRLGRVDGAWLQAQGLKPGPLFRDILDDLLDARRAGLLETPEAEEAMARRWLAERGFPV